MNEPSKRLDALLKSGAVKPGTRFLYQGHGAGTVWEGVLLETSAGGQFVKLDDSGQWEPPAGIFVVEIWPEAAPSPQPSPPMGEREKTISPDPAAVAAPAVNTTRTTHHRRKT